MFIYSWSCVLHWVIVWADECLWVSQRFTAQSVFQPWRSAAGSVPNRFPFGAHCSAEEEDSAAVTFHQLICSSSSDLCFCPPHSVTCQTSSDQLLSNHLHLHFHPNPARLRGQALQSAMRSEGIFKLKAIHPFLTLECKYFTRCCVYFQHVLILAEGETRKTAGGEKDEKCKSLSGSFETLCVLL